MLRGSLVFLATLLLSVSLKAQTEEVCKWVTGFDKGVTLDSLTVYPESIRISKPRSDIKFTFDLNSNSILIPNQGA
ncbi:MAG: hypothetical protein ACI82Q_002995, partial [Nonlabens sp.]